MSIHDDKTVSELRRMGYAVAVITGERNDLDMRRVEEEMLKRADTALDEQYMVIASKKGWTSLFPNDMEGMKQNAVAAYYELGRYAGSWMEAAIQILPDDTMVCPHCDTTVDETGLAGVDSNQCHSCGLPVYEYQFKDLSLGRVFISTLDGEKLMLVKVPGTDGYNSVLVEQPRDHNRDIGERFSLAPHDAVWPY